MKLYTTRTCKLCHRVKAALTGHDYTEFDLSTTEGHDDLQETLTALELDMPRTMPVLVTRNGLWSGDDCLVAIQEGEL